MSAQLVVPKFWSMDAYVQTPCTFKNLLGWSQLSISRVADFVFKKNISCEEGLEHLEKIKHSVVLYSSKINLSKEEPDQTGSKPLSVDEDSSVLVLPEDELPERITTFVSQIFDLIEDTSDQIREIQISQEILAKSSCEVFLADHPVQLSKSELDPKGLLAAYVDSSTAPNSTFSSVVSVQLPQEIEVANPQYHPRDKRLNWNETEVDLSLEREWQRAQWHKSQQHLMDHFIVSGSTLKKATFFELSNQHEEDDSIRLEDGNSVPIQTEIQVFPSGTIVGVSSCQGQRSEMEDEHLATTLSIELLNGNKVHCEIFAVFDGHGGKLSAHFAKKNLAEFLKKSLQRMNPCEITRAGIKNAFKEALVLLDEKMKKEMWIDSFNWEGNIKLKTQFGYSKKLFDPFSEWYTKLDKSEIRTFEEMEQLISEYFKTNDLGDLVNLCKDCSGTTAIFCIRLDTLICVGNVGDSRAILKNGSRVFQLSSDAKPVGSTDKAQSFNFKKSIYKRGGKVGFNAVYDASGNRRLLTARALNDKNYLATNGTYVICPRPKVLIVDPKNLDLTQPIAIVLICDGVTDVATTEEIASTLIDAHDPATSATRIVKAALSSKDSTHRMQCGDNVTTMVVRLPSVPQSSSAFTGTMGQDDDDGKESR